MAGIQVFVTSLFVLFNILECLLRPQNSTQETFGRHCVPSGLGNTAWLAVSHSWPAVWFPLSCLLSSKLFSPQSRFSVFRNSSRACVRAGFPDALRDWDPYHGIFSHRLKKTQEMLHNLKCYGSLLGSSCKEKTAELGDSTELTAIFPYLWCVRCAPWVRELSPTGSHSSYICGLHDYWG